MIKTLLALILFFFFFSCKKKVENSKQNISEVKQTENKSNSQKTEIQKNTSLHQDNDITNKNNDFWKGSYHFEASNRDDAKTIFDITINSLEDISLDVIEEGVKNKYSSIKADEISNEKIKINYDNSSDNMGTIYIERSGNNYFISGNPIYFINPGNNEMPLQKLKK